MGHTELTDELVVDFGTCPACNAERAIVVVGDAGDYLNQGIALLLGCLRCSTPDADHELKVISAAAWTRRLQKGTS